MAKWARLLDIRAPQKCTQQGGTAFMACTCVSASKQDLTPKRRLFPQQMPGQCVPLCAAPRESPASKRSGVEASELEVRGRRGQPGRKPWGRKRERERETEERHVLLLSGRETPMTLHLSQRLGVTETILTIPTLT